MRNLIQNKIQCNNCKEEIESYHKKDFKMCKCNKIKIYDNKIIGDNYKENSVIDDCKHETRRNTMVWGQNYDKNMNRLPKTKWVKIKDLDTSHIWNILLNVKMLDGFYKEVLTDEIMYREDKWYNKETLFYNYSRYTERNQRLGIVGKNMGKFIKIFILTCSSEDAFEKEIVRVLSNYYFEKGKDQFNKFFPEYNPQIIDIFIKEGDSAGYTFNSFCNLYYKKYETVSLHKGYVLKNKEKRIMLKNTFKPTFKL